MQSKSTSKREVLKGISLHVINKSDRWDCRGCDGPAEPSSKPVRLRAAALPSHPLPEQRSHSSEEITRCTAWVESREGSHGDFFLAQHSQICKEHFRQSLIYSQWRWRGCGFSLLVLENWPQGLPGCEPELPKFSWHKMSWKCFALYNRRE